MRLLFILLFCLPFFWACSSGEADVNNSTETQPEIPEHLQDVENLTVLPADSESLFEIDLVEERNFGDKYDDVVYLGYINDFAVDDQGRVYLADAVNDQIHVYNPDGSFLRSIGRSGRGPGEFLTVRRQLDIGVNSEYLFAYDATNFRISRFSLDTFELVDIVNLDFGKWNQIEDISGTRPFRFYIRDDGNYLVKYRVYEYDDTDSESGPRREPTESSAQYYLFNPNYEPVSGNILEHELPETFRFQIGGQPGLFTFPFTNVVLTDFSESGRIYKASSEEFLIRIYNPDGSYARSIYHPVEAAPFTDENQDRLEEENDMLGRGFRRIDLPEQWPVLNQIKVDDENRLWVSIITESQDSTEWWVLDEDDKLLAKFSWPRNLQDRPGDESHDYIIKNGAIYYLDTDPMNLDQQTVVKYRIEMNPINGDVAER